MPQMIDMGNELIRINPRKKTLIEYSSNKGSFWMTRYSGTNCGDFIDLCINKNEILACTSKGLYFSNNKGAYWACRYYNPGNNSNGIGKFIQVISNGPQLLAATEKGLYYSTNNGAAWQKKI